jgi:hypothetical protein
VRDDGEFDRREEVASEASSFIFVPCEGGFVFSDEVVHKVAFFWP